MSAHPIAQCQPHVRIEFPQGVERCGEEMAQCGSHVHLYFMGRCVCVCVMCVAVVDQVRDGSTLRVEMLNPQNPTGDLDHAMITLCIAGA